MSQLKIALTELVVAVASFLGWNAEDILKKIPEEQPQRQIVEQVSTTEKKEITAPKQSAVQKVITTTPLKMEKSEKPPETKITKSPPIKTPVSTPQKLSLVEKARASTVNIYCSWRESFGILRFTGSASVISQSGLALTNAHVAQYLLLQEYLPKGEMDCHIRSGSPARNAFRGHVVYMPLSWAKANKGISKNFSPSGTGENDFAIIELDDPVSNEVLSSVSWLSISNEKVKVGDTLRLSGYPAGFSNANLLESALYSLVEKVSVNDVWPLGGASDGAIGTSPTSIAQVGSSGGAAINDKSELAGLMVATTLDSKTGKKNMRVISISHIKSVLKKETGKTIDDVIKNSESLHKKFKSETAGTIANLVLGK